MDERLARAIFAFQAEVERAIALLAEIDVPRPASNHEWARSKFPQLAHPGDAHRFEKHGYGIAISGPDVNVDFDFGANGEIDGFDPWRLNLFVESRRQRHGFGSDEELSPSVESAVIHGRVADARTVLRYSWRWASQLSRSIRFRKMSGSI